MDATNDTPSAVISTPVRILVCSESQVSELIRLNKYNFVYPYLQTSSLSTVAKSGGEKPKYILFNSISYWVSRSAEKKVDEKGEAVEMEHVEIDSTLLHHVCLQPYLNVSCDVGQEKLFVSPTDAQLALKLALHEQKLESKQQQQSSLPLTLPSKAVKIVTSSSFTDTCEDSNSILTVELNKFGLTSDSTFLEKLLLGGLCQEDVDAFQQFLDVNNKYDVANALSSFIDYLSSNKDEIHSLILRIPDPITENESCGNILEYIHPLEVVFFKRLQEKFLCLRGSDETEFVFEKHGDSSGFFQLPEISKTELTLFSSWASYLTLLVNSRCELSLARTLNVPDRELDPSVFKALKKTAKEKEMPMFQTALSHITQVRLGGKGYRPSSKSLLGQHVKGLGDYVDFVDRLRSHLEDYNLSPRIAIKRVLLSLQREFLGTKKSTEFRPFVDSVYKQFLTLLKDTCTSSQVAPSPKTPNSGGTLAGREAFKVLHRLITKLNLIHSIRSVSTLNFASNLSKLNHTPVLEAFKSPAEVKNVENFTAIHDENAVVFPNDDHDDAKPIKETAKTPDNRVFKKSRKSQEINWAKTPETPFFKVSEICQDELSNGVLDLDERQDNNENSPELDQDENDLEKTITMEDDISNVEATEEKAVSPEIVKVSNFERKVNGLQTESKKRKVLKDVETTNNQPPASKKSLTQKVKPAPIVAGAKSKTKDSKVKQVPLKGQKSLTSFFKA